MIKIEKGHPIPPPKKKYPWHKMEVGDSFAIPVKGEKIDNIFSRLHGSAWHHKKDGFRIRAKYIKKEGVVRCWRIA